MDRHKIEKLNGQSFRHKKKSSSKLLQAYIQFVFNESARYQNLSTHSSSPVDFTMHALSQMHCLRAYKTKCSRITKKCLRKKSCRFDENKIFSIIVLPAHVQYGDNESIFFLVSDDSTNILLPVDFTVYALYSHGKATFQEEQSE